jgi:hypothetical protein
LREKERKKERKNIQNRNNMLAKTKKGQKKSKSLSWALAEQQLRKT